MWKKLPFLLALALSACSSQDPSKDKKSFYDANILFDLDAEVQNSPCHVTGEIPYWLSGTLLRNGPAKFTVGDKRVDWFDGLAMLHAFSFTPNQVQYSNRFIRSKQYYKMMVEKSLDFAGFSQDPCSKGFQNQSSRFVPEDMKDIENADVSIAKYADKMVALTETPLPVVFDPGTLQTLGAFEYQDPLPKSDVFESAHPQHDIASGKTINYLVRFGEKSYYEIWRMYDHHPARSLLGKIPVQLPSYMHSFALTENYVILVQFPFVVNPLELIQSSKSFIQNFKWKPEMDVVFLIVDRGSGIPIASIESDPFFAFHHVNAFDIDDKIVIDIVTYPNADVIERIIDNKEEIDKKETTKLQRFTITLPAKTISRETMFDKPLEMPRVPASRTAHPYQYCYAVDYRFPITLKDKRSLYKIDVAAKTSKEWSQEGCYPGEPIFVPRPGGQDEDDGVVLSLVLDFAKHKSFLLILDAENFTELARAEAPHAIPAGFHGMWKK